MTRESSFRRMEPDCLSSESGPTARIRSWNGVVGFAARLACGLLLLIVSFQLPLRAEGEGIGNLEHRVTRHTLKNGLRFLLLERHTSPTLSFHVLFNVGSVDEQVGRTGIAHLYEHMAFKGTSTIGTRNVKAEIPLMKQQDALATRIAVELDKGEKANLQEIAALRKKLEELETQQSELIVDNEFSEQLERNGGVGLNAQTGRDATEYYISLPANKAELWALLESDRMTNTVLRQFYKERDVVQEERRLRIDNQPFGKLFEKFVVNAFEAHPYGLHSGVGWPSDLQRLTRTETEAFYRKYYVPSNAVVGIVGDFKTAELIPLLDRYFAPLASAPAPAPIHTREMPQGGEKRVQVEFESQPILMMGYHRPSALHADDVVFDVITNLLSSGRTSRLYRNIVEMRQLAAEVEAFGTLPMTHGKYPGMFTLLAVPLADHSVDEIIKALQDELDKLKTEPVSRRELQKNINQVDAAFVRRLRSNSTMAGALAQAEAIDGDWKSLLDYKERVAHVTPADIQRVAAQYFTQSGRVVSYIVPKAAGPGKQEGQEKKEGEREKNSAAISRPDSKESSESSAKAAEELWQKALTAKGGLEALKPVRTSKTTSQIALISAQETLGGSATRTIVYPGKICEDFSISGESAYQTLANDNLWIVNRKANQITLFGGVFSKKRPNSRALQMKMALYQDAILFFVQGSEAGLQRELLDPVDGMPGIKIKISDGDEFKAYFDPETFQLKKLTYSTQPGGEMTHLYSDYKAVGNIQVPFRVETFLGSFKSREEVIKDFQPNVPISEEMFTKPEIEES